MASELFVDKITGTSGTSGSAPLSMSGNTLTATLGASSTVPASIGASLYLISKATASTSASLEFTGINSLTQYRNLVFYVNNLYPASDSDTFLMQIATSGTTYVTSGYLTTNTRSYYNGSASGGNFGYNAITSAIVSIDGIGNQTTDGNANEADGGLSGRITLYSAPHDVEYHNCHYEAVNGSSDGYILTRTGAGKYHTNSLPITAVRCKFNSGNITSGSIAMYGIKDA